MALHLEIVTPKGSIVDVEAEEVILPGKLGEFGVLGGHIPFLSALRPGLVSYKDNGTPKLLAVGTGFAEVGAGDKVLVLTDECASPDEVDVGQTEQELLDAETELREWEGKLSAEHQELQDRATWAQARLDLRKKRD